MKSLKFCKLVALIVLLVIFCSSCGDDDPVLPDYTGTWMATATIATEDGNFEGKQILTLTDNSFSDLAQIHLGTAWVDMVIMKGSVSVTGNRITRTVKELGTTTYNMATNLPTGVIVTSKEGDEDFNAMLQLYGLDKTFTEELSVSGNQLTLKSDDNHDGDYLDDMETTVFTRQ